MTNRHFPSDRLQLPYQARPVRSTNRQQLYQPTQQLDQQLFAPLFRVVDRPLKVVDQNNSSQNGRFWDELFSSTTLPCADKYFDTGLGHLTGSLDS